MDSKTQESQHTFGLFMKLSSFLRFSLQEMLPKSIDKAEIEIPKCVFEEIEELKSSVTNFIQKYIKNDTSEPKGLTLPAFYTELNMPVDIMMTHQEVGMSENKMKDELENGLYDGKWIEMLKKIQNSIDKKTGKVGKKGFYCGICDYYSFNVSQNTHFLDERHITLCELTLEEVLITFKCNYCGIKLFGGELHLLDIVSSSLHQQIHKTIVTMDNKNFINNSNEVDKNKTHLSKNKSAKLTNLNQSQNQPSEIKNKSQVYKKKSKKNKSKMSENMTMLHTLEESNQPEFNKTTKPDENELKNEYQTDNSTSGKTEKKKDVGNNAIKQKEHWKSITERFQKLNSTLKSQEDGEGYYCKPCGMIIETKPNWDSHCMNISHSAFDIVSKCKLCKLEIFMTKKNARVYMKYHKEMCHSQSAMGNNCHTENTQQLKEEVYTPQVYDYTLPSMSSIENGDQIHPKFLDILKQKRMKLELNQIVCFSGLCLNCDMTFSNKFDWIDHFNSHQINHDEEIEECFKCNLGVFGNREIARKYMQHPDHIFIDSHMID